MSQRLCRRARPHAAVLVSIVDSISACHAEDRGSIPRRGDLAFRPAAGRSPGQRRAIRPQHRVSSSCPTERYGHDTPHTPAPFTEIDESAEPKGRAKNHEKKWLADMTAALVSLCSVAPLTPRSFAALVAAPHTDTPIGRSLILLRALSEP